MYCGMQMNQFIQPNIPQGMQINNVAQPNMVH